MPLLQCLQVVQIVSELSQKKGLKKVYSNKFYARDDCGKSTI